MAAVCREVICLQLGPYADCVGAHWWGLQHTQRCPRPHSELCSDVQFRAGLTLNGEETYTPRLLIVDIKDGVSSARGKEDEESDRSAPAWRGEVTTHQEEPTDRTAEPPLQGGAVADGGSRELGLAGGGALVGSREESHQPILQDGAWPDYLCTELHPKSLCILSHRSHGSDVGGLQSFSQGESLLTATPNMEEAEDRLRFFSEECDFLQGFHILCDSHSGFSGVGAKMAELIHDDYPGRGILSFGTNPVLAEPRDARTAMYQLINHVMSMVALTNHSSAFCPLSLNSSLGRRPGPPATFPHLLYDAGSPYQSSAVLGAALDAITAPYRLTTPTLSMSQLTDTLTFGGRKILAASCSLPFPIGPSSFLPDALHHMTSPPWRSVSACPDGSAFSQSVVLRGIPRQRHISSLPAGVRPLSPLHACCRGDEVLHHFLSSVCPQTLSVSHLLGAPCTPAPTFPHIFSPYITTEGYTVEEPLTEPAGVAEFPVMAVLHSPCTLRLSLRSLCQEAAILDVRRWANFPTAGIEEAELREAINEVRSLSQCYHMTEDEDD